jgi:biotin carboxyl carrier protein
MTESGDEQAGRQPHPGVEQRARAGERAFVSAHDQNVVEIHYHTEVVPAELREVGSLVREIAATQREIAGAQYTVLRAQQSIRIHYGLVDFLLRMQDKLRRAATGLAAECDRLRGQLQRELRAQDEQQELRAQLNDSQRRLDEAERARDGAAQRLAEAERQLAEAILLKDEALEQLRQCRNRITELEGVELGADNVPEMAPSEHEPGAEPLMGGTDQWIVSGALRSVDDVLKREASNLDQLRGIVAESGAEQDEEVTERSAVHLVRPVTQTLAAKRARSVWRHIGNRVAVFMPSVGESVFEGTVIRWLRRVGDYVHADEGVVDITTDKVDIEIPAPESGYLREINVADDETVPIGTELGAIEFAIARTQDPIHQVATVTRLFCLRAPEWVAQVTQPAVSRWLKQEGDYIRLHESLLHINTEFADIPVPCPVSGTLRRILVAEEDAVGVGARLALIDADWPILAAQL